MAVKRKRKANPQSTTHVLTSGTTIRIEEPSSDRRAKPNPATVIVQEANPLDGFVMFLREHAIVGLAVGFAIATQVQALVKQLITSFIDPLYGLFFTQKLSEKKLTVYRHGVPHDFGWGAFAYTMLDFLFVIVVIYFIIKVFNLDKWDRPKKKEHEVKEEE
jgi:large-conductance mechanosensitive channel